MSGPTKRNVAALLADASSHEINEEIGWRVGQLPPDASECTLPLDMSKHSSALTRTVTDTPSTGGDRNTHKREGKRIRTSVAGIPEYVQRDETFARLILQPMHQENYLDTIFAMLNCMDVLAKRDALNHPYKDEPGRSFHKFFMEVDKYDGKDGYTASDASRFLQFLQDEGVIAGWTLKTLKKFDVTELLLGTRRVESGDNILIFGCAKTTETEQKVNDSTNLVAGTAQKQDKSKTEVNGIAVTKKTLKTVGIRFRTNIDGELFAEIVDPAKKVSQALSVKEYAGCMGELESTFYVFRIELPGENA